MHGEFFLLENGERSTTKANRLPLGETRGRNEAWLRDTLFANPDLLPVHDIEPAYGPLLPLCTELRTTAGPLDIAFINPVGRLTLVECKLWRNAEARRKVVAQVLDYARAIKGWSYADLQRQVSVATGRQGNIPFEIARTAAPNLQEHQFIDNVSRSMREGRFLLLIAGDGIREDVGGIADLINRNATSGFSFGQVEVALYEFPDGSLAIQPRAISKTHLIERFVIVSRQGSGLADEEETGTASSGEVDPSAELPNAASRDAEAAWWQPVTQMRFDDPEQDQPKYRWRNHVRAQLPVPGLWLTGYASVGSGKIGVFLTGNHNTLVEAMERLDEGVLTELPPGSERRSAQNGVPFFAVSRPIAEFSDEDAQRDWIAAMLNAFANTLRPRLVTLFPR